MFCRNCGSQIPDGASVCGNCGRPVEVAAPKAEPRPEPGPAAGFGPKPGQPGYEYTQPGQDYQQPAYQAPAPAAEPKSSLAAGLFGILLGTFGVHNFYLGFTGKAVAQLLITLLSCGGLAVVSSVWGLVEGILYISKSPNYTTDANGVTLK